MYLSRTTLFARCASEGDVTASLSWPDGWLQIPHSSSAARNVAAREDHRYQRRHTHPALIGRCCWRWSGGVVFVQSSVGLTMSSACPLETEHNAIRYAGHMAAMNNATARRRGTTAKSLTSSFEHITQPTHPRSEASARNEWRGKSRAAQGQLRLSSAQIDFGACFFPGQPPAKSMQAPLCLRSFSTQKTGELLPCFAVYMPTTTSAALLLSSRTTRHG